MAKFTRGFMGRGNAARDVGCRRASTTPATSWPVLTAEVTPDLDATWTFTVDGLVEQADDVDLGRDPRAPGRRRTTATSTA